MSISNLLVRFGIVFIVAFVANAIVVYLWDIVFHSDTFHWGRTLIIAVAVGIALTLLQARKASGRS